MTDAIQATLAKPKGAGGISAGVPLAINARSVPYSRNSLASYFDSTGTLQFAAANVLRDTTYNPTTLAAQGTLIEGQATNYIRNPRAEGAVIGTPVAGVSPLSWFITLATGWSSSIVATGTESGIPYIDLRFFGTATAGSCTVLAENATIIPTVPGVTWTASIYLRIVAGSTSSPATTFNYDFGEQGGSGSALAAIVPTGAGLATQRFTGTRVASAGTLSIFPRLRITPTLSQATDFTVRIGGFQMEQGSVATSLILPPAGSTNICSPWYDSQTQIWGFIGTISTHQAQAGISPNGTQTASLITAMSGTASQHGVNIGNMSAVIGFAYTASIYVMAGTSTNFELDIRGSGWASGFIGATYDLVTLATNIIFGSGVGTSATITAVGGGWFRCTLTSSIATSGAAFPIFALVLNAAKASNFSGAGESVYIWGAQVEKSTVATTFTPYTRYADNVQATGIGLPIARFNEIEGTSIQTAAKTRTPSAKVATSIYATPADARRMIVPAETYKMIVSA